MASTAGMCCSWNKFLLSQEETELCVMVGSGFIGNGSPHLKVITVGYSVFLPCFCSLSPFITFSQKYLSGVPFLVSHCTKVAGNM
jgi:hypothetical protein